MRCIDLSNNIFSSGIEFLNLSHKSFTCRVPTSIGRLGYTKVSKEADLIRETKAIEDKLAH